MWGGGVILELTCKIVPKKSVKRHKKVCVRAGCLFTLKGGCGNCEAAVLLPPCKHQPTKRRYQTTT